MVKNKTMLTVVTPRIEEMLDKLQDSLMLMSRSEVVRLAIVEMYEARIGQGGNIHASQAKVKGRGRPRKEEGEKRKEQELISALDGELVDLNGAKVVRYKIYEVVNPVLVEEYEQEIPLSHLSKELVDRQYKPNREEVEKVRAKMKDL